MADKVIPLHMIPDVESEIVERDGERYLESNESMFTFYKRSKGEFSKYFLGLKEEKKIYGAKCPEVRARPRPALRALLPRLRLRRAPNGRGRAGGRHELDASDHVLRPLAHAAPGALRQGPRDARRRRYGAPDPRVHVERRTDPARLQERDPRQGDLPARSDRKPPRHLRGADRRSPREAPRC